MSALLLYCKAAPNKPGCLAGMQEFGTEDDSAQGPLHEPCFVGTWTCRVRPRSSDVGVCCCGCSCPKGSVLDSQGPAKKPARAPRGAPGSLGAERGTGLERRKAGGPLPGQELMLALLNVC